MITAAVLSGCADNPSWQMQTYRNPCSGLTLAYVRSLRSVDPKQFESILRDLTLRGGQTVFFANAQNKQQFYNPTLVVRLLYLSGPAPDDIKPALERLTENVRRNIREASVGEMGTYTVSGRHFTVFDVMDARPRPLYHRMLATINNQFYIAFYLAAENQSDLQWLDDMVRKGVTVDTVSKEIDQSPACKQVKQNSGPYRYHQANRTPQAPSKDPAGE